MERDKRSIIVNEIEQWQRSKLLPDQYCDFLLNLYRDSDQARSPTKQKRKQAIAESKPLYWMLIFGVVALLCYVSLYFNSFSPSLQIGIFIAAALTAHGVSAAFRQRKPLLSYVMFGAGAFVLLAGGAWLSQAGGIDDWGSTTFYIACCALIWIAFGLALRVPWIHLCGWAALLLVYAVAVNRLLQPESWLALQLCWVPLALLFGWVGWLSGRKAKASAAVFFIVACLVWFAPEAYALAWTRLEPAAAQLWVFGKLAALGGFAFGLRRTWSEWVV